MTMGPSHLKAIVGVGRIQSYRVYKVKGAFLVGKTKIFLASFHLLLIERHFYAFESVAVYLDLGDPGQSDSLNVLQQKQ